MVKAGRNLQAKAGQCKKYQILEHRPPHIKGKVNGVEIFILSKFVKKV